MSTKPAQVRGKRGTLRGYIEYSERIKPAPKHDGTPHTKCARCGSPMAPTFKYTQCYACNNEFYEARREQNRKTREGRLEVARAILALAARKKELGIRR